ncbi:putative plectin-like [Sesbania bispinosa]|nr:putative plectin-like [Sesbania bispinosa]
MTEEEVANVRSEEIHENGDDHSKIKAEHCNGVARVIKEEENDNVGGEVDGHDDGKFVVVVNSGDSDPVVTVDGNGAATEEHKVEGESEMAVMEVVNNKENDCADAYAVCNGSANGTIETATVDVVVRESESGSADGQNGSGSAAVLGDEKDVADTVGEYRNIIRGAQNGVSDMELSEHFVAQKEMIDDLVRSALKEVMAARDHELKGVTAGVSDVQNGVAVENETSGEVDVEGVADVNMSNGDLENVAVGASEVRDSVVVENEMSGDVDVNKDVITVVEGVPDDVNKSDREFGGEVCDQNGALDGAEEVEIPVVVEEVTATAGVVESVDSDVQGRNGSVSDNDHETLQSEIGVCADISDEKHIVTNGNHNVESEGAVGAEVQNGFVDGECAEKNEIPVDVDVAPAMKECAGEDAPNGLEKAPIESVSDVNVEVSQCAEETKVPVDAVENEAEPSNDAVKIEDEDSKPAQEGSTADTLDEQNMGTEVVRKPFYYLIRLPRYDDDENIKEQIKYALHQVDEKTKIRDTIRVENQTKKAICKEYDQDVRAAISAERAARDLLRSKRQEMDSVQYTLNRLNNAISIGDIDDKIRNMEHMIQHETLPLKEEKQLIRQIKQLKQNREELAIYMGKQDESHDPLDHKDNMEECSKQLQLLKKEMEVLRNNVQKTEAATKAARKKYEEENKKQIELQARFQAADDVRQEAYAKLQALKKQLHDKSKYFWEYKNAAYKGQELAAEGKKEELQSFCVDQVERIMELWNNNDEFRRNYVRCNTRSTLRRLQTMDGRSLGPDEEPPVIPNNPFAERVSKIDSLVSQSTVEQEKKSTSTESVNIKDESVSKAAVQRTERSQTTKPKKPAKPVPSVVARWGDESDEDTREEPVRTKEEEERILKAEMARKEEEAAKLKEMRRLEEIEKAKEAQQRKKRNAEKAQQRAALKAQKEAEQKEKAREKRQRKKDRRKAASTTDTVDNKEQESAPSSETLTKTTEESDQSEKPVEKLVEGPKRQQQRPSHFTKQTKVKSLPMSLRNRGKRRFQPWMWVLIAVLVAVALFYMGNNNSLRSSLAWF